MTANIHGRGIVTGNGLMQHHAAKLCSKRKSKCILCASNAIHFEDRHAYQQGYLLILGLLADIGRTQTC